MSAVKRTLRKQRTQLAGNYIGFIECHTAPDWLLIYELSGNNLMLCLTETGTHTN